MRSSLPVEKPVEKLPFVCGKLYSIARNSFCTKMSDRPQQLFHKFSTGIYYLQVIPSKQLAFFSTVSTGRSTQK
ncbi:hypothetical protein [Microcoleus asticus]|uniref:hypothetical protein n=1 Tax=Microcoleus asticus TaxID=2815231 RepID=UPI0015568B9D|nr:hypothetical protein [Microcoleus asticus]